MERVEKNIIDLHSEFIMRLCSEIEAQIRGEAGKILMNAEGIALRSEGESIPITIKIDVIRDLSALKADVSLSWERKEKHKTEKIEIYVDALQPKLPGFEMENINSEKSFPNSNNKSGKKKRDTMAAKRTLNATVDDVPPCDQANKPGCCICEEEDCADRLTQFGNAVSCGKETACSPECPRLIKE